MKFLRFLFIAVGTVAILFFGYIEGLYYYHTHNLSPEKQLSETNYSKQMHEVMWVVASESGDMKLDKLSMTSYVFRTFEGMGSPVKSPDAGLQGSFIAAFLARGLLNDNQQADSSEKGLIREGIMTVWVTKNYSLNEAMNALIDRAFLKGDNAILFFNKPIDSLSLSENLILGALLNRPDLGDFCGHETALAEQADLLLEQLKQSFPTRYDAQTFEAPEYSEAVKAECLAS